jgi:hypothetical protein
LTNQISQTQTASTSVSANNPAFQQLAQAYTMVADLGDSYEYRVSFGRLIRGKFIFNKRGVCDADRQLQ